MPCAPQEPGGAAARTNQLAQKLEKNVKNLEKPNACPFPLIPIKGSLEGHEKISEKKVGKTTRKEPRWIPFCGISQGETSPCTLQKPEGAAARTTQLAQKLEKTLKTYT